MNKAAVMAGVLMAAAIMVSCDSEVRGPVNRGTIDRSKKTVIDDQEYIDFTIDKYNAKDHTQEQLAAMLGGRMYRNGNSYLKINALEGTIEISTDRGFFNGKEQCQIYAQYAFEVMAASKDSVYLRRNARKEGLLMVDANVFRNDQIPDLAVCIPLYGYSRNRVEVSSVMNGFIAMPSGTYWHK